MCIFVVSLFDVLAVMLCRAPPWARGFKRYFLLFIKFLHYANKIQPPPPRLHLAEKFTQTHTVQRYTDVLV